jgi:S1-C subfamily serine protease
MAVQHQGDEVLVLGYPLGLDGPPSLTRGLISAMRLNDRGLDLLQTDAASGGSSGSPVINARGKVLGIQSYGREGLSFAIAAESIASFLAFAPPLSESPLPWLVEARTRPAPTPVPAPTPRPSRVPDP